LVGFLDFVGCGEIAMFRVAALQAVSLFVLSGSSPLATQERASSKANLALPDRKGQTEEAFVFYGQRFGGDGSFTVSIARPRADEAFLTGY